jgi:dTDP-4-amino-4,6-dideoxygalactose transaminase
MDVPYINLAAGYSDLQPEIDEAVLSVLASGNYVLGENVEAFGEEFGCWLGGVDVATVNSGTDALYLTLKALEIGAGDEVITVSHTAVNTALAVSKTGATPVFVDIDPDTYCMDPQGLEAALTPRTSAIIPVHLYGHPADMDPILEFAGKNGLAVIEDCAQAHGAKYKNRVLGTLGTAGCFSFYPTKNLGAFGDGGAVVTADSNLAAKVRSLANCGQGDERYLNIYLGDVSRLDEVQAAILRVKLKKLDMYNRRRREIASVYKEGLFSSGLVMPPERDWAEPVYHLFVVRSQRRDELQAYLGINGVRALIHYPTPVHLQPAYINEPPVKLPSTERIVLEILSLPVFPEIEDQQLLYAINVIQSFQQE